MFSFVECSCRCNMSMGKCNVSGTHIPIQNSLSLRHVIGLNFPSSLNLDMAMQLWAMHYDWKGFLCFLEEYLRVYLWFSMFSFPCSSDGGRVWIVAFVILNPLVIKMNRAPLLIQIKHIVWERSQLFLH